MGRRVCIVGAGVSGLAAIKCCLDESLEPVCLEQDSDIGGLWNFTEEIRDGYPSLYKSCVINTSKELTCYSDFPIPKEFPNFMHHSNFKKYLELYAEHFNLKRHIRFRCQVKKADRVSKNAESPTSWQVTYVDLTTGSIHSETVDYIMACHGHLHIPNKPQLPGLDQFSGKVLHTHDYKDFRGFEGKTVLVIGIGNSAADVACELSRHAKHVYVSTRRGTYVFQRAGDGGVPFDHQAMTRLYKLVSSLNSSGEYQRQLKRLRYDHIKYSLAPNGQFGMTISDDLPNRILLGAITIKDNVSKFTNNGAVFEDGTKLNDIDVVVLGTGYKFTMPFLDAHEIRVEDSFPFLYKFVFPVEKADNSLAVIGLVQPFGALPPILEMQARWAARVFSGKCCLPSTDVMLQQVERVHEELQREGKTTARYSLQIHYIDYNDDIAAEIGCLPRLWRYFFTDPRFWWTLITKPLSPAQWRLDGPGKWKGAREAVMGVEERTWYPLRTRRAGVGMKRGWDYQWWLYFGLLVLLMLIFAAVESHVFIRRLTSLLF